MHIQLGCPGKEKTWLVASHSLIQIVSKPGEVTAIREIFSCSQNASAAVPLLNQLTLSARTLLQQLFKLIVVRKT